MLRFEIRRSHRGRWVLELLWQWLVPLMETYWMEILELCYYWEEEEMSSAGEEEEVEAVAVVGGGISV